LVKSVARSVDGTHVSAVDVLAMESALVVATNVTMVDLAAGLASSGGLGSEVQMHKYAAVRSMMERWLPGGLVMVR
jgi:hypothetical protein